ARTAHGHAHPPRARRCRPGDRHRPRADGRLAAAPPRRQRVAAPPRPRPRAAVAIPAVRRVLCGIGLMTWTASRGAALARPPQPPDERLLLPDPPPRSTVP